jgi:hypothetical protein
VPRLQLTVLRYILFVNVVFCNCLCVQIGKPEILSYFSLYFVAVCFVVLGVFQRIRILKVSASLYSMHALLLWR